MGDVSLHLVYFFRCQTQLIFICYSLTEKAVFSQLTSDKHGFHKMTVFCLNDCFDSS